MRVQETPVNVATYLLQVVEVVQALVDVKVTRVINRGLGPQGVNFFEVLLDLGMFVLNIEAGQDPVLDNACSKPAGCVFPDMFAEDQLHMIRSPQVQIVPDDVLKKLPALQRFVEDLG